MASAYTHLYKLYGFLIQSYVEEMKLHNEIILLNTNESRGSCLICCSTDSLRKCTEKTLNEQTDNFSELLLFCFRVRLVDEESIAEVCDTCVSQLRDSALFRKQIEAATKRLEHSKCDDVQEIMESDQSCEIFDDPFQDEPYLSEDTDEKKETNRRTKRKRKMSAKLRESYIGDEGIKNVKKVKVKKKRISKYVKKRKEWIDQIPVFKSAKYVQPRLDRNSNECPICKENFVDFKALQKHYNVHFHDYLCDVCGKKFGVYSTYKNHLNLHKGRIPCTHCPQTFSSHNNLSQHIKVVHLRQALYTCPHCEMRFFNCRHRRDHITEVHNVWIDPHICPVCQLKCYTALRLDQHNRQVHLNEKNVTCQYCGKREFSLRLLKKHIKDIHTEVRSHICAICDKSFKTKKHLRVHLNIHSTVKASRSPTKKSEPCTIMYYVVDSDKI